MTPTSEYPLSCGESVLDGLCTPDAQVIIILPQIRVVLCRVCVRWLVYVRHTHTVTHRYLLSDTQVLYASDSLCHMSHLTQTPHILS